MSSGDGQARTGWLSLPSARDGVLQESWIIDPSGYVQNFQPDEIAVLVVVEDHARLVLVAFSDRRATEEHAERIRFRVIGNFDGGLQYLAISVIKRLFRERADADVAVDHRAVVALQHERAEWGFDRGACATASGL